MISLSYLNKNIFFGLRAVWATYGWDAVRNTLVSLFSGIIIFLLYKDVHSAIVVSIGAVAASLVDISGSRKDKWMSLRWCIPVFFLVSYITGVFLFSYILLIFWLILAAFVCGMSAALGLRVFLIGVMALALISFTIGLWPSEAWSFSLLMTSGALWYFVVSLLQAYVAPYRALHATMRSNFMAIANLLREKAKFYDPNISIERAYESLSGLHVIVSEQQDQARLLLLREKKLLRKDNKHGQFLLQQLYSLIDLYELLTAIDHDYDAIRKELTPMGAMEVVKKIILLLADTFEGLSNRRLRPIHQSENLREVQCLLQELLVLSDRRDGIGRDILEGTIHNIQAILDKISSVSFDEGAQEESKATDFSRFIPIYKVEFKTLVKHVKTRSAVFLFSIRWAILFGLGGAVGFLLPEFRYSYWVLLTIAIVARPTYFLTHKRNSQRLMGTLYGLIISFLSIYWLDSTYVLFSIAFVGLFCFFLFNTSRYTISVLAITITAVVLLYMYEGNRIELLGSRLIFTLIGILFAFIGWFIVPVRQVKGLYQLAQQVLETNKKYLDALEGFIDGRQLDVIEVRLYRKRAHNALASFSEAFNQLKGEPGQKKEDWEKFLSFQAVAYRANSLIVGIAQSLVSKQGVEEVAYNTQDVYRRIRYVKELLRVTSDKVISDTGTSDRVTSNE